MLEGLEVIQVSKAGRKAYKDIQGDIYLDCCKCNKILSEDLFTKHPDCLLGKSNKCKECDREYRKANKDRMNMYSKQYRKDNKERELQRARRNRETDAYKQRMKTYRENNREKLIENMRVYRKKNKEYLQQRRQEYIKHNKEKMRVLRHRRWARKRLLPDTLTLQQRNQLGNICVITGRGDVHLDHVIPLAIGHGGTTYQNMIPLSGELNISKHASNVFEWAEQHHERLGFTMDRFKEVMTDVADRNGMTLEEYRDYVYWCFENPVEVTA